MRFISIFIMLFLLFAQAENLETDFDKFKNFFKKRKKQAPPKVRMVETVQEWLEKAENIPLEERKLEQQEKPKSTKKYYYPTPHYIFEKYNYPQGHRELSLENIKKNLISYPYIVADKKCHHAAYSRYYYSPDANQISSNFYIAKLDTSKTKTKRILEYNHNQEERYPIIESGTKEIYPNLFKGLTLVDWSADSKKLLIKEKVGSAYGGIYKTFLYVHFMPTEIKNGYTIRLTGFDEVLKDFYLNSQNVQLAKYRYDIEPLGFAQDNDDMVIVLCYVFDNNNNKILLGTWGYDIYENTATFLSSSSTKIPISANGLIIRESVE